ncbi:MAG: (4Fe-4S)-binding protein [Chloroflexi bacterium]|nr:(4Fe-4S)-binding protein [Chloroflexota bacterium]
MLTAEKIKQYAKACGADLVGIGSMDRFEGAPLQMDPRYIMPEGKSIIGLGFRIHRGLLRGIEEGTFFAGYPAMGYANINDVYAPMVLREVGNLLEDEGYEALLYQNTSVRLGSGAGQAVSPDKPRPDVFLHFRIAGFICGMGEIGWSKVFLTPQFGPRQRLAFILTDAPLEPDPLFEGGLCDRCMSCVRECPAGAISETKSVKVTVAGRELEWNALDTYKCGIVFQTGAPQYGPFLTDEAKAVVQDVIDGVPEKETKIGQTYPGGVNAYVREQVAFTKRTWDSYHHPGAMDGARGCIRACMMHLESRGVLENKFHNKFRQRKPWSLGGLPDGAAGEEPDKEA